MAEFASLGESPGHVIRICSSLKILQMACNARRAAQAVIIVRVAVGALSRRDRVGPGQLKAGGVVIERGIEPGVRIVALLAGLREVRRCVVRTGCALVILQVT